MRKILSLLIYALLAASAAAQELNCRVEVNSDKITGTNKSVFTTLQEAITSYMNDTKFTAAQYSPIEKTECTLFFTIKEYDEEFNIYRLGFPNKEVAEGFIKYLVPYYMPIKENLRITSTS